MCFLSVKIEGTCLKYMCDMHARSPSLQMHVEQNPTEQKMSFSGYVVEEVIKKQKKTKRGQLLISWCLFMISSICYSENVPINVRERNTVAKTRHRTLMCTHKPLYVNCIFESLKVSKCNRHKENPALHLKWSYHYSTYSWGFVPFFFL